MPRAKADKEKLLAQLHADLHGPSKRGPSPRQQSRQHAAPASASVPKEPEWKCGNCQLNNWPNRVNCRSCRHPREVSAQPFGRRRGQSKPRQLPSPAAAPAADPGAKASVCAASDSMDLDAGVEPVDDAWSGCSMGQLKQEAHRLEQLIKTLKDTKLPCDPAQARLAQLRTYMRAQLPLTQRLDSLQAQVKKQAKLRETLETSIEDQRKKLVESEEKLKQAGEKEAELQRELAEVMKEASSDTVLDSEVGAQEVEAHVHDACREFQEACRGRGTIPGDDVLQQVQHVHANLLPSFCQKWFPRTTKGLPSPLLQCLQLTRPKWLPQLSYRLLVLQALFPLRLCCQPKDIQKEFKTPMVPAEEHPKTRVPMPRQQLLGLLRHLPDELSLRSSSVMLLGF